MKSGPSRAAAAAQTDELTSCLARIEQSYGHLAETVRRVADVVLHRPADIVGLSISEVARLAEVSDTTVLRFARGLGYSGYRQFALALAATVVGSSPEPPLDVDIQDADDIATITRKVYTAEADALAKAWQTIDVPSEQRAVDVLARARRVHLYAVGGSGLLAMEAVYRFTRVGLDCTAVYDPIQIAIHASRLTGEDVVIGFSQSGRTRDTVEGLRIARAAGATTICVTARPRSPITRVSDIVLMLLELQTAYRGAYLDSKIAELTLIDVLATCLARRLPDMGSASQEALESGIARMFHE